MNESVDERRLGDAEQQRAAGGRLLALRRTGASFSCMKRNLSTTSSIRNSLSPTSSTFTQRIIWRDDDLDVLVVDVHALQAVDLLDLVHQVPLQLLLAAHAQDVVRVDGAVHERLAGLDPLAFLDVDVGAARAAGTRAARCRRAVTKILRCCLATSPYFTTPSISVMTAGSFGRRASNSSTTRGRPPVMSLVLAVSRGILASTSPGVTSAPSSTMRWAPEGSRYLRSILPFSSRISMRGCFFSSERLHDDERRHPGVLVHLLVHGLAVDDVLEGRPVRPLR